MAQQKENKGEKNRSTNVIQPKGMNQQVLLLWL
jgi:hypothetical protein